MGKRKRAKPPPKKAKPKVSTVFDCPFCGKNGSCAVKMEMDVKMGKITCDACGAKYEARISALSEPIDVYAEWIDMCEDVNAAEGERGGVSGYGGEDDDDDL
eukprot:CAMPEP_0119315084 /NCGR_PEP_ID=MMETSP1333-20130426/34398_1 /TAXON_ID=418940 /ORGANISM="Scyphosphaera apsteinii, Strain RCC1455" /LENGTH=101 /DNA_ID=CAMNT_0007320317 /DNA_START=25 /DNA_END=330 /DNA_ORIENTATION=+